MPDIKSPDEYASADASAPEPTRSIWRHPHFVMAVVAQFFYVAAQSGIFSFFINYMTAEMPALPATWSSGALAKYLETHADGHLTLSNAGAAALASVGFFCFMVGRFSGAAILRHYPAHRVLGLYGVLNVLACGLVFLKLGWVSVGAVFASYFFMSIMFPTIFALGIHGLGGRAKQASSYIVMAIMGGAVVPKIMGAVGDHYGMARSFIVPLACFAVVAFYGYNWARFSRADRVAPARAA